MSVYFITGIDTWIGKTFATGLAARFLLRQGISAVTQKIVQTGVSETIADDILLHRRLMGIPPLPEDVNLVTCPYCFRFAGSPHLAAELENVPISPTIIADCTKRLLETFEIVLLEGAGGINVPLGRDYLIADYLQEHRYPLILVTSGRLGSINHTLLTLEAAANRNIPLAGIVFNHHPPFGGTIQADALAVFRRRLDQCGRPDALVEMPEIVFNTISDVDFSPIFDVPR